MVAMKMQGSGRLPGGCSIHCSSCCPWIQRSHTGRSQRVTEHDGGYPRRSTRVKRGTPLTDDFGLSKSLWPGWNFLRTALPPETLPTQSCFLPVSKPQASSAFSSLPITGISLNNSLAHFIPLWHLLLRGCKLAHRSQICFYSLSGSSSSLEPHMTFMASDFHGLHWAASWYSREAHGRQWSVFKPPLRHLLVL